MKKVLERSIPSPDYPGNDTTGVILLQVEKVCDSIKMSTLYSSMKEYRYNISEAVNSVRNKKYVDSIPVGYIRIVPVYFYFWSLNDIESSPSKNAELGAVNYIKALRSDIKLLDTIKLISTAPIQ